MTPEPQPRNSQPAEDPAPVNEDAPEAVEPVEDPETGEELGEVSGGGEITDLGGDAPSS